MPVIMLFLRLQLFLHPSPLLPLFLFFFLFFLCHQHDDLLFFLWLQLLELHVFSSVWLHPFNASVWGYFSASRTISFLPLTIMTIMFSQLISMSSVWMKEQGNRHDPLLFLLLFQWLKLYLETDSPVAFLNDFGVKYDHKALFDETS